MKSSEIYDRLSKRLHRNAEDGKMFCLCLLFSFLAVGLLALLIYSSYYVADIIYKQQPLYEESYQTPSDALDRSFDRQLEEQAEKDRKEIAK